MPEHHRLVLVNQPTIATRSIPMHAIADAVDKQLEHLKRQARAAEQYQAIQAERLNKDAQLKALEFRKLDAELHSLREGLTKDELKLQQILAEQRAAEAQIETCRVQQHEAGEKLSAVQAEGYRISGELARIEQQIRRGSGAMPPHEHLTERDVTELLGYLRTL